MTEQLTFRLGEPKPDILQSLTPEQRRAAEHPGGPLLVVAGAGTGKTHVLTARIVHLIASGRAKPHQILALTFTEKAAATMQERVDLYTPLGLNDRKSTRLNSSHGYISYAVFCLKKKNIICSTGVSALRNPHAPQQAAIARRTAPCTLYPCFLLIYHSSCTRMILIARLVVYTTLL